MNRTEIQKWHKPTDLEPANFEVPTNIQTTNNEYQRSDQTSATTKIHSSPYASSNKQNEDTHNYNTSTQNYTTSRQYTKDFQNQQTEPFTSTAQDFKESFKQTNDDISKTDTTSNTQNSLIDKLLPIIMKMNNGGLDLTTILELLDKSGQGLGALGKLLPIITPLVSNGMFGNLFGGNNKKTSNESNDSKVINLDDYKKI